MRKYFAHFDWLLLAAALVLLVLGLFILASATPLLFRQQLVYALLSLLLLFLFSQIDYRIFEKLPLFLFLSSLVMLGLTFLFGSLVRGTVRWLQLGGLNFQPSEMVKPLLILFFAWFFSRKKLDWKQLGFGFLFLMLPVFLIFWQPDLGSSLVVAFSWLGIVLGAGIIWQYLVLGLILLVLGLPLIWRFLLQDYQRQRIISFLNPLHDPLGAGYNLIQAMVAVGSGQWLGRGFGRGTQSHLKFLPEGQTDFIFASFAEELGFLGTMMLIFASAILLWRILVVAGKAKDSFGYLICLGVFSSLFFQTFVNIGMNLGLLPIAGVPLPLISYGGSSLVATMISLGLVESISRWERRRTVIEIR